MWDNSSDLQKQRRLTIIPLIKSFLKYLVYFGAGVSILKLINIDPAPILAGAGIVGIAVVNYSKDYIYAMVEVSVASHWNLDRLYRIIEEVGQQLKAEEPDVLEPTKVEGLENLGKDNLLLYTVTKVKPGRHMHVQRVLRKMLKHTFDREEIDISMRLDS